MLSIYIKINNKQNLSWKLYFSSLYLISGLIGNFYSLLFNLNTTSVGDSGAIIGIYGNFLIYFFLNYRNMTERKRYSYLTMFFFLFINLFSDLTERGENSNMATHYYRMTYRNKNVKIMYYCSKSKKIKKYGYI